MNADGSDIGFYTLKTRRIRFRSPKIRALQRENRAPRVLGDQSSRDRGVSRVSRVPDPGPPFENDP